MFTRTTSHTNFDDLSLLITTQTPKFYAPGTATTKNFKMDACTSRQQGGSRDISRPSSIHLSPLYPQDQHTIRGRIDEEWDFRSLDEPQNNRSPIKTEYITPQQQLLRNQHRGHNSSPISIASTTPDRSSHFSPPKAPFKRPGSPLMSSSSSKRHQTYHSPPVLEPSRPLRHDNSGLFNDLSNQFYDHERPQHRIHHHSPTVSISRQSMAAPHTPTGRTEQSRDKVPSSLGKLCVVNGTPRIVYPMSQKTDVPGPRSTSPTQKLILQCHSPQQQPAPISSHSSEFKVLQTTRDTSRSQENVQSTWEHEENHDRFQRTQTVTPNRRRLYREDQEDGGVRLQKTPENLAVRKPSRPTLGSPLWKDGRPGASNWHLEMVKEKLATNSNHSSQWNDVEMPDYQRDPCLNRGKTQANHDNLAVNHVKGPGHYHTQPGKLLGPVTPENPRRRAMGITLVPQPAIIEECRGRSKPRPPRTSEARSKSSALSQTCSRAPSRVPSRAPSRAPSRDLEPQHAPLVHSSNLQPTIEDDSSEGSTPMDVLFKRNQRVGHTSDPSQSVSNLTAANLSLFQDSIFPKSNQEQSLSAVKPKPVTPPPKTAKPAIFDIVTPSLVKAIPMKDLIPPISKPAPKRESALTTKIKTMAKATAAAIVKKAPRKEKAPGPSENPEAVRQKLAAQRIMDRAFKGAEAKLDEDLFGEVIAEDAEAKEARLEAEKLDAQKKRETKMAELLAREEEAQLVEMEKLRVANEEAEKKRLAKEQEEHIKKAKRDAERKLQQAIEIAEQNEKRRIAAERIEHARAEAERIASEKAKEKLEAVRAESDAMAKIKAKQEEAKKFAASLKFAKIPGAEDTEAAKRKAVKEKTPAPELSDEESLFVPEITGKDRTRAKSAGPSSALEAFTKHQASVGDSAYALEREAAERDRAAQQAAENKKRLEIRWKTRAQSEKPEELPGRKAPSGPHPKPVKAAPPNPSAIVTPQSVTKQFFVEEFDDDFDDLFGEESIENTEPSQIQTEKLATQSTVKSSASTSANTSGNTFNNTSGNTSGNAAGITYASTPTNTSAVTSFSGTKSTATISDPSKTIFNHKIQLISDLDRQQIDKENKAKQTRTRAAPGKRVRTEAQRLARKARDDEKARQRKRKEFLDKAEKDGAHLSEIALNTQVDAYMEKRNRDNQRRNELYRQKQQNENFAPDALALSARSQPFQPPPSQQQKQLPKPWELVVEGDISEEQRLRKENEKLMHHSLTEIARQRGSTFKNAANIRTVNDFDSDSEESEEDPLPEQIPIRSTTSHEGDKGQSDDDSDSIGDTLPEKPQRGYVNCPVTPPPITNRRQSLHKSPHRTVAAISAMAQALKENKALGKDELVRIYAVQEKISFDGLTEDFKTDNTVVKREVGRFATIKEANAAARHRMRKPREKYMRSILESYDSEEMVTFRAVFDEEEDHVIAVWVEVIVKATKEIDDEILERMEQRVVPKLYEVWEYSTKLEEVDAATGFKHTYGPQSSQRAVWTERVLANSDACEKFCQFIKPKGANIDHLQNWTKFVQNLRDVRDALGDGELFAVEMDKDENCPWLEYGHIEFEVKVTNYGGPLN